VQILISTDLRGLFLAIDNLKLKTDNYDITKRRKRKNHKKRQKA